MQSILSLHLYRDLAQSVPKWLTPTELHVYDIINDEKLFDMEQLVKIAPQLMKHCIESQTRTKKFPHDSYLMYSYNVMHDGIDYLHNLQWLYDHHYDINDVDLFDEAAEHGHLKIMKWLHKHGCPYDDTVFDYAAQCGNLACLKWLHKLHFPHDERVFANAARQGNLDILKWLHKCKFPHDKRTFVEAIRCGNLVNLQWLYDHKYIYDHTAFYNAVLQGNLDCLKWLHQHKFPCNEKAFTKAIRKGNLDVIRWLYKNNYPWDKMWETRESIELLIGQLSQPK